MGPLKAPGANAASTVLTDAIYAMGSMLLLAGMGHLETLFRDREQARRHEEAVRSEWESRAREETEHLARTNQELLQVIADRDQAVDALKESESRYRFLFTENPQPMWILDIRSCRFLAVNQAALRQYGFTAEEFMALTGRDLMLPPSAAAFLQDVSKPCPEAEPRGVWQHCKKDGTLIDVDISALDLTYGDLQARLILATDITEHRRQEMASRKAHKMETIGQVAGGVAHHFNNILTIIEGHASLLIEKRMDLKSAEQLEHISAAVTRASGLTRQLLAAGGRISMRLETVDLNELIRKLNPLLCRLAGEDILIENACSYLPHIQADRRSIEHVIVNLVLNARDAMMPNGGNLILSTAKVHIDDRHIESGHPGKTGDFVRLSVRDTGSGMTPQVQSRLFEPLFTTKDSGQDLGLGLAGVYGIVKQHSGWVEYSTDVGVGTEFHVFFPCPSPSPALAQTESGTDRLAKGTILLVEADERARTLARFVLNRHGYRVIEADCCATALVLWQSQAAHVDLLFTGATLPGDISGCELANRLRQTKPELKVVYSSSQASEAEGPSPALPEGADVIFKPFTPDKLVRIVHTSLGS